MKTAENNINKLFDELVPPSGKADTVAGEIIRAVTRIGYRNYNDGDHIGVGYGKETCNPAARYLMQVCDDYYDEKVPEIIINMWGIYDDEEYDRLLEELEAAIIDVIEDHPELKSTKNEVDMWDYRTNEDVDDSDDEDEWY